MFLKTIEDLKWPLPGYLILHVIKHNKNEEHYGDMKFNNSIKSYISKAILNESKLVCQNRYNQIRDAEPGENIWPQLQPMTPAPTTTAQEKYTSFCCDSGSEQIVLIAK